MGSQEQEQDWKQVRARIGSQTIKRRPMNIKMGVSNCQWTGRLAINSYQTSAIFMLIERASEAKPIRGQWSVAGRGDKAGDWAPYR